MDTWTFYTGARQVFYFDRAKLTVYIKCIYFNIHVTEKPVVTITVIWNLLNCVYEHRIIIICSMSRSYNLNYKVHIYTYSDVPYKYGHFHFFYNSIVLDICRFQWQISAKVYQPRYLCVYKNFFTFKLRFDGSWSPFTPTKF